MAERAKHSMSSIEATALKLKSLWNMVKNLRRAYNRRMSQRYSASAVATIAAAICLAVAVILLFLPRYIGVADDGSLYTIMNSAGLKYRTEDANQATGAYFVRIYERTVPSVNTGFSTHILLIRAAMGFDNIFTHDNLFDIRFLAFIYLCLYIPAVWLLVKQAALRVRYASEGTVIGAAAVLLFADVSYISYFNSLYPEAVWFIGLLYCCGLCLSLQRSGHMDITKLVLLMICGIGLTMCEQHCAVIGFILAVFCLCQIKIDTAERTTRAVAVISAAFLIMAGLGSLIGGMSRFNQDSKFNAMANGVLLESTNPEKTLSEFGIDARFETIADTSSYSFYPLAKADNSEFKEGFYDRYSTPRLMLYYMRHPISMGMLLELGVRAAFNVRRDYCGNYELSSKMPARGRTPLFAISSNFRVRSAPKTLGYLLLLAIVYCVLLAKWNTRRMPARARLIAFDTFWTFMSTGIIHMVYIILRSGTSELSRYCMIFSVCIDLVTLLTFAEILHRLNILETGESAQ